MAFMIPPTAPKKPNSEKVLYLLFKEKLPDDFIVWHNPSPRTKTKRSMPKADFVILSKEHGLLFIEAKGYSKKMIKEATMDEILIERGNEPEPEKHPLAKAEEYKYKYMDRLKKEKILKHPKDGKRPNKLIFPTWHIAWLTHIKRDELEKSEIDLSSVFDIEDVLLADDIKEWQDCNNDQIIKKFRRLFGNDAQWSFKPLTNEQIDTIRGVLHPSTRLKRIAAKQTDWNLDNKIPDDTTIIQTLDLKQEIIAKQLGEGHRVIAGVAGSGKTLILINRAKLLAQNNDNYRILVTCYNITLSAYLRSIIDKTNININKELKTNDIRHFHSWAGSILQQNRETLPRYDRTIDDDEIDNLIGEKVIDVLNKIKSIRYDAILVDEAHLMHPTWLKALTFALKDSQKGSLLIINDGSQKLRRRKGFTWRSVGIAATGRTRVLTHNYRNTREIINSSWNILSSLIGQKEIDKKDETFPVITPEASKRKGKRPRLIITNSCSDIISQALIECQKEIDLDRKPEEIGLLYNSNRNRVNGLIKESKNLLKNTNLYWVTESKETKLSYNNNRKGIRLVTTQSALGLEFKSVYLLWGNDFDQSYKEKDIHRLRELYVAMTRAQEQLTLIFDSSSELGKHLSNNHESFGLDLVK